MESGQQSPKTTVVAIISKFILDKEFILLTKRNVAPYKEYWCLPGGHIKENEPSEEAVIREVWEETELVFYPKFYKYYDEIIPEERIHAIPLIFVGISSGNPIKKNDEINDAIWVSLEDVSNYSLAFHHNAIIENYITNHPGEQNENVILSELKYLREEILNRFETRDKMIYYTIFLAGIIITFGKTEGFILFPVLGTVLAGLWSHNDIRVADIAEYIKTQIEPRLNGLAWENHLYNKYKLVEIKDSKRQERYVLWVFNSTYIIMILFSGFKILDSLKLFIKNLWCIDSAAKADILLFFTGIFITLICMIKTGAFIKKRRQEYTSKS